MKLGRHVVSRAAWRRVLDRRGSRLLLGLLESAADTRKYRRAIWLRPQAGYWYHSAWKRPTEISDDYRWRGPDFWRDLTADLLCHRYSPRPGDVVVDVGAGMGEELPYLCAAVSTSGKVVAVEAHPHTFEGLRRSVLANKLTNCIPVWGAITDQSGFARITDGEAPELNSLVARPTDAGFDVPSFTLDALLSSLAIHRIDLLKMNIEGAERLAIRAMEQTIDRTRNAVISCHDFLADEGGGEAMRTKELVLEYLTTKGLDVSTREDRRPFVRDYLYATRGRA